MAWTKLIDKKHYGIYRDADGRERSAGSSFPCKATTGKCAKEKCAGYRDAKKAATAMEDTVNDGTWTDPTRSRMTFGQYIEEIYWPVAKQTLMPSTRRCYRQRIDAYFLPCFGDVQMRLIHHSLIQGWVVDMERGIGPACKHGTPKLGGNIKTIFATFQAIMHTAMADKVIPSDPTSAIKLPPPRPRQITILEEGIERFEAEVNKLPMRQRLLVLMLMETAARLSEVRALRPRHLKRKTNRVVIKETVMSTAKEALDDEFENPREGFVRINERWYVKPFTKNGIPVERWVSIDPVVMKMLGEFIDENGIGDDDLIFTTISRKRGRVGEAVPFGSENFYRDVWNPLVEKAKLPERITPHKLRHTAGSIAVSDGASITSVQYLLGHSSPRTTEEFYVVPTDEAVDEVAEARARAKARRQGKAS